MKRGGLKLPSTRAAALAVALCLTGALSPEGVATASLREGVRILGDLSFPDVSRDGVDDWLVGRAECFSKEEGQAEVTVPCVALIDGRRWVPMWHRNVPRFGAFPPVMVGRWVVVDVGEPVFTVFDATRPGISWEFRMEGMHTAPMTPVGTRVLLVVGGDHLYFIDPGERVPVWDLRLWSPVLLRPVVVGTRVAVATAKELAGIDLADGRVAWRLQGPVHSILADSTGVLHVAVRVDPRTYTFAALNAASGLRRWRRQQALVPAAPPLLGQDHLYAFGQRQLLAFDRADGSVAWTAVTPPRPTPIGSDENVVVSLFEPPAAPQEIHAYDRETGKRLWARPVEGWRYEPTGRLTGGVLVLWARERVSTGPQQGRVEGLAARTGAQLWSYDSQEKIVAMLAIGERRVRFQRQRGLTEIDTKSGAEIASRPLVALAHEESSLADRLRYLVYVVPPLIIVTGIAVWVRHRLRRRR